MTAGSTARVGADALLADYLDHVAGLGLGGRAIRDRTRIAREFLSRHPDLASWMALPAAQRADELRSTGAWPLVCYTIGTGRIRLDVELAAVKQLTGLGAAVEARDPAGVRGGTGGGKSAGLDQLLGRDGSRRVPGGGAGLARRAGRRPHRRGDRRVRCRAVSELDSALVTARLPGAVGQSASAAV